MHLQVQVYVDSLVKKAYDNWDQVVEYDGKSLLSGMESRRPGTSGNELHIESIDYGLDHQLPLPVLPGSVPSEQQINSGLPAEGKHGYLPSSFCSTIPSGFVSFRMLWIINICVFFFSGQSIFGLYDSYYAHS